VGENLAGRGPHAGQLAPVQVSDEPVVDENGEDGLAESRRVVYLEEAANINARVVAAHVVEDRRVVIITVAKAWSSRLPGGVVEVGQGPLEARGWGADAAKELPGAARSHELRPPCLRDGLVDGCESREIGKRCITEALQRAPDADRRGHFELERPLLEALEDALEDSHRLGSVPRREVAARQEGGPLRANSSRVLCQLQRLVCCFARAFLIAQGLQDLSERELLLPRRRKAHLDILRKLDGTANLCRRREELPRLHV